MNKVWLLQLVLSMLASFLCRRDEARTALVAGGPFRPELSHHLLLRGQPRRVGAGLRPPDRLQARVPQVPQEVHWLRHRQVQEPANPLVSRGARERVEGRSAGDREGYGGLLEK